MNMVRNLAQAKAPQRLAPSQGMLAFHQQKSDRFCTTSQQAPITGAEFCAFLVARGATVRQLGLTTLDTLTTRHRWVRFRSPFGHSPAPGEPGTFLPTLTTTSFERSSSDRFGTRS